MFDDPDSEEIDLCEREVKNHVPDPVGEELDRLAAVHGVTTVSEQIYDQNSEILIILIISLPLVLQHVYARTSHSSRA